MHTTLETPRPRRAVMRSLDGDGRDVEVSADLTRALTRRGRHNHTDRHTLWRVHGWDKSLCRDVPIGYVVLNYRSSKFPGAMLGQPEPIAFIAGVDRWSLLTAREIDADHSLAFGQLPRRGLIDALLYPVSSNGDTLKLGREKFPAAMFRVWRGRLLWNRLTHAQVAYVLAQKNSGRSEPSNAVTPEQQISEEKGIVTAA